jgi:hypothetical protein
MEKPRLTEKVLVRLPADVAERLRDAAIENARSVSSEVRHALTKAYAPEPPR